MLDKIISYKKTIIERDQQNISFKQIENHLNTKQIKKPFTQTLLQKIKNKENSIISEIKRASPSKGIIRENFDVQEIAKSYQQNQASCLSILTDEEFFKGNNQNIKLAREVSNLPILRKDFIIDKYQIAQAKYLGADAILFIIAILSKNELKNLFNYTKQCDLDILIEVHDRKELEIALEIEADLIGINNRNLKDFTVDLKTSIDLIKYIPKTTTLITESGIKNKEDVKLMNENNIFGFLVGEAFMMENNPGEALKKLFF